MDSWLLPKQEGTRPSDNPVRRRLKRQAAENEDRLSKIQEKYESYRVECNGLLELIDDPKLNRMYRRHTKELDLSLESAITIFERDIIGKEVSDSLKHLEENFSTISSFLVLLEATQRRMILTVELNENPYVLSERELKDCEKLIDDLEKQEKDTPEYQRITGLLDHYSRSIAEGDSTPRSTTPAGDGT